MKKLILLLFIPLVFTCGGSEGGSDSPCPNQPQLTTLEVSNIGYDENTNLASATFSGEIQNIQLGVNCETFSITNQGFVYSTNIQPTTSDNVVNANGENASANVSDLIPETTYYVRAYLTNTLGTFYGNEVSFTAPECSNCPLYFAENGVTVKAKDWVTIGETYELNGESYLVVNDNMLLEMVLHNSNFHDLSKVCTSFVTNMQNYFYMQDFNQDISSWDTSNVLTMRAMFHYSSFNQDISYWDTSSVLSFEAMFEGAAFNQNISSWDVSSSGYMSYMFRGAYNFNQDLSSWDVNSVADGGQFSNWICLNFCADTPNWTLPKPNFTNCSEDLGCD